MTHARGGERPRAPPTWPACPAYCQYRAKYRACSTLEHGGVAVPAPGQCPVTDAGRHGSRLYSTGRSRPRSAKAARHQRRVLRQCSHQTAVAAGSVDRGPQGVQHRLLRRLGDGSEELVQDVAVHALSHGCGRDREEDLTAAVIRHRACPRQAEPAASRDPGQVVRSEGCVRGHDGDAAAGRWRRRAWIRRQRIADRDPRRNADRRRCRSSPAREPRVSNRFPGRTRLDVPMPAFQSNAVIPAPAPTQPSATGPARGPSQAPGRRLRSRPGRRVRH